MDGLIRSGVQAFSNKQYREAADHWQAAIQLAPSDTTVLEKLGHASLRLARFNDAERYFRKAVELKPDAWTAWIEIGRLSVLSLDLQGGEEVWKLLKAKQIRTPHALIYHGDLAMLKNEFNEAELDYRQALAIAPERDDGIIKLAISLQVQDKKTQAAKAYERMSALEINDPLVLIQMGHYWNLVDDFKKAETYMLKALDLDPADLRIRIRVANFFTAAGKYHDAAVILEPVLGGASLAISKEYADLLIRQNKIADAMSFLKPILSQHPNDDALKLMVGKGHLLSGNAVFAASEINAVAEKNPDSPSVHYLLGVAYLAGGYNQMGIQHLTKALTLDNDFSDAELALAACYYKTGEYALARQHAQRVAGNDSGKYRPYMLVGATYLEEGEYPMAKQAFAMAANLNPGSLAPLYFGAMANEFAGLTSQARVQYEHLLSEDPMKIDVVEQYIAFLINNGQETTARRFLEVAVDKHPDDAYSLYMLGDFYVSVGEPGLATEAFEKSIGIDPHLTLANLQLAHLYEVDGDLVRAVDILENAVAVNPAFSEGAIALAQLYCERGNIPEAIGVLESAYAMDRENATVINNLATLYLEDDAKLVHAFELAQKAYGKNSADPANIDTLGWAYYKKGLYRRAAWYLTEAEKKIALKSKRRGMTDPESDTVSSADRERLAIVSFHLGMAQIGDGEKQSGVEKLNKAIEFGLDGEMKQMALMAIGGGR